MSETTSKDNEIPSLSQANEFFDQFISNLQISQYLYSEGMAPSEEKTLFDNLILGNMDKIQEISRRSTTLYCAMKALRLFLVALFTELPRRHPEKLAVEMTGSKLLVWAEVKEDDEEMMRALLLADASATVGMDDLSYATSITVVEDSDKIPVPGHYKSVLPKEGV